MISPTLSTLSTVSDLIMYPIVLIVSLSLRNQRVLSQHRVSETIDTYFIKECNFVEGIV